MGEPKNTPAPWQAVEEIDTSDPRMAAKRWNIQHVEERGVRSIAVTQGTQNPLLRESNEANAHLMAAAPDLLEACEWAQSMLDNYVAQLMGNGEPPDPDEMADILTALNETIAKARGDQVEPQDVSLAEEG